MKDNVILEVKNVEKFFYGNKKLFQKDRPVVKAVNDVSFTINEGETFGIVGESGCGKSTLGRTVIRLLNPTSGQVLYKGTDLATLSGEEMRKLRQEIQIIFQDPYASLNPRMTVRELIQAPLDVYSHESEAEKLAKISLSKLKNLTGKEKPLFGNMQSIGIIPEYRNRRLSNYLVEQCLQWLIEKTEADIVIGVCWKPGGKVPMEKTLKRYEFSHLADVRRLWYDRVDLICPVCRGRCECDAAIYYKRLERNVAQ